jgi:hypothetical protein
MLSLSRASAKQIVQVISFLESRTKKKKKKPCIGGEIQASTRRQPPTGVMNSKRHASDSGKLSKRAGVKTSGRLIAVFIRSIPPRIHALEHPVILGNYWLTRLPFLP